MKGRSFGPFRSPIDNYVSQTQGACVFGGIVLDDSFKPVRLRVPIACIAEKQLLSIRFRKRFNLHFEKPFHIFQGQFLSKGPFRWITYRFSTSDTSSGRVFGHLCIESLPDV